MKKHYGKLLLAILLGSMFYNMCNNRNYWKNKALERADEIYNLKQQRDSLFELNSLLNCK